jgi:large subunit ribosomal protein L13
MRRKGSKERGPYFPKRSDMILRRTIRGMLPYKKAFGKAAFSRLRVYMGIPKELTDVEVETLNSAHKSRLSTIKVTDLEKVSQRLGAKNRVR